MTEVLVLCCLAHGRVGTLAHAAAEGTRGVPGAEVLVGRAGETASAEVARKASFKLDQSAPVARPSEVAEYDAVLIGTPTRRGRIAGQMVDFWDQTGGSWANAGGDASRQPTRGEWEPARLQGRRVDAVAAKLASAQAA